MTPYRDTVARGLYLVTLGPGQLLLTVCLFPFWCLGKCFPWRQP